MPQSSDAQHRRSVRLRDFDYAANGAYFVTLCTHEKTCRFGTVVEGEMQLNESGEIVREEWLRTADVRPQVVLDAFVIMPNHLHGIIMIDHPVGAHCMRPAMIVGAHVMRPYDEHSIRWDRLSPASRLR